MKTLSFLVTWFTLFLKQERMNAFLEPIGHRQNELRL